MTKTPGTVPFKWIKYMFRHSAGHLFPVTRNHPLGFSRQFRNERPVIALHINRDGESNHEGGDEVQRFRVVLKDEEESEDEDESDNKQNMNIRGQADVQPLQNNTVWIRNQQIIFKSF